MLHGLVHVDGKYEMPWQRHLAKFQRLNVQLLHVHEEFLIENHATLNGLQILSATSALLVCILIIMKLSKRRLTLSEKHSHSDERFPSSNVLG
jgi:hypothetical protein